MNILFCKWDEHALRAILDRGAAIHLLLDAYDIEHGTDADLLGRVASVRSVTHFDSLDELSAVAADLLLSGVRIDRVASFTEFSQFGAGMLAHLLGLPDPSPGLAMATRDKRIMKVRAGAAGWRHARFATVSRLDAPGDPATLAAEVGLPLIVKPANGMGSLSTVKVDDVAALADVLADHSFAPQLHSRQLVLEEFVPGAEYHVDAVWRDGEPWMLHISRYLQPRIQVATAGRGNGSVIIPRRHAPHLYAWVEARHPALNEALGFRTGVSHLEMFQPPGADELWFSEIASRMAGAFVPEAIAAYSGVDIREAWAEELCGGSAAALPVERPPFEYVGWINLAPDCAGIIDKVPSEEALSADPNVLNWRFLLREGDRIDPGHPSAWCLFVVVGADTENDFHAAVERIEREHVFTTTPLVTVGSPQ